MAVRLSQRPLRQPNPCQEGPGNRRLLPHLFERRAVASGRTKMPAERGGPRSLLERQRAGRNCEGSSAQSGIGGRSGPPWSQCEAVPPSSKPHGWAQIGTGSPAVSELSNWAPTGPRSHTGLQPARALTRAPTPNSAIHAMPSQLGARRWRHCQPPQCKAWLACDGLHFGPCSPFPSERHAPKPGTKSPGTQLPSGQFYIAPSPSWSARSASSQATPKCSIDARAGTTALPTDASLLCRCKLVRQMASTQ
mmetsp:Transcript_24512/g.46267  ORF Transcript_24512/g.46267 Transcript_24512/m.46267 type:complete len:250 (-) Transcript_24512:347-1096(-)